MDQHPPHTHKDTGIQSPVTELYRDWFLEYASYVILDRAVPFMNDGLKPVQRRLLHAMNELEDGRYNKAANIIGHTMRYHPHGDQAIGDALVKLAQKDLLIDTQGNWGNTFTGDRAAASRYIEARLTPFAKEVLFNPKTTQWLASYDGRNKEPISLPVKFPLLLAQGAEGIAVGLATRILPHNFCEIIKAGIQFLKGRKVSLVPDFPSGGIADFSNYNDGKKGGRIKVRAVIEAIDAKNLRITELPFGTTTTSLIESIISANDKNKIKIKHIEDNTAKAVDILIELPSGTSTDHAISSLYAFTDCEQTIAANCCIIQNEKPRFMGISELLQESTLKTKDLLRQELEIKLDELNEKLHFASLEKIFIEHKIYRKIETATTWEAVLTTIAKGLKPFSKSFLRPIHDNDILRLTEIKIKRISKYDSEIAEKAISQLENSKAQVNYDLKHLTEYTISFLDQLLQKYGKGRERRTKKSTFEDIKIKQIAIADQKVYVNRKEGFIGVSLKKDEYLWDCTAHDELIAFTRGGTFTVVKVAPKVFVGKDVIYVAKFRRGDDRRIFHMVYQDLKTKKTLCKRFQTGGITRDKEYDLTKSTSTKVIFLSDNPNGESEIVACQAKAVKGKRKPKPIIIDFGTMEIKSRSVKGQTISEQFIENVEVLEKGDSTLEAQEIWIDLKSGKLNQEERGIALGECSGDEVFLVISQSGQVQTARYDINGFYGQNLTLFEFYDNQVVSLVYYEGERQQYYVKRFMLDKDSLYKSVDALPASKGTKLILATTSASPLLKLTFKKDKQNTPKPELFRITDQVDIKSIKALGTKLSKFKIKDITLL